MSTFNFLLVNMPGEVPDDLDAVLEPLALSPHTFRWRAGGNWIGCGRHDVEEMWTDAENASGAFHTDAISVLSQAEEGYFELHFYSKGKQQRRLVFSADQGGWVDVVGQPLPWENDVFYGVGESPQPITKGSDQPNPADDATVNNIMNVLRCQFPEVDEELPMHPEGFFGRLRGLFGR